MKKDDQYWSSLKDKKRIVIKIGSSTLTDSDSGYVNLSRVKELVDVICNLKKDGKEVILVSSGAVAVGRQVLNMSGKPKTLSEKQACASVGQCHFMTHYQGFFSEKNIVASQILMTKIGLKTSECMENLINTFETLLKFNSVPVVNENDAVSPAEIVFGDNDTLSAIVSVLTRADLLIILSDINGLYTDDPTLNSQAELIPLVKDESIRVYDMAKRTSDSDVGTGGMFTKVSAARIANESGIDMVIANGKKPSILYSIMNGDVSGTLFMSKIKSSFDFKKYVYGDSNEKN